MIGIGIGIPFSRVVDSGGAPPVNTVAPVLSGLTFVGQTLTSTTGTWTGTPPISYSYVFLSTTDFVNFTVLQSSTSPNYVVQAADAGKSIRCNVNATNSFGSGGSSSNYIAIKSTILDIYPTDQFRCYYLTLQRGAYYGSPCIRVRRSGDNSETNIGFNSSGNLDTASLTAFVIAGGGTQNGFIVTYFDQTTNAVNTTQTNPSKQAQIVSSGVVMTNGGLTISDYVSASLQEYTNASSVALPIYTIFHYNQVTAGNGRSPIGFSQFPIGYYAQSLNEDGFRNSSGSVTVTINTNFIKRVWVRNSNNGVFYRNGIANITTAALNTTTGNNTSYMNTFFGTYSTEKVRGTICYSTDLDEATVIAITNLLD
jgi:hypothetical protein